MDAGEAAEAAVRIVNAHMARAIRIVTVERGHDPRDFSVVAFGGAGPMHAAELAEEIGVGEVLIPRWPGLFSALGLLVADLRGDLVRTVLVRVGEADLRLLDEILDEMAEEGVSSLGEGAVAVRWVEARYEGQSYELPLELPSGLSELGPDRIRRAFGEKHEAVYGYSMEREVEIVTLRVTAVVPARGLELRPPRRKPGEPERREVFFSNHGWEEALVYRRGELPDAIEGPAVVEEYDSTTLVPPGWTLEVDGLGNLVLRR